MIDLGTYRLQLAAASDFVCLRLGPLPEVCIIAGTGLGDVGSRLSLDAKVAYSDIPHFPSATVTSHHGWLLCGSLAGSPALVMQGRFHLYEGHDPWDVAFPIRVLAQCGVRLLIITNAAGGLDTSYRPGDLMLIADHINMTGKNVLAGPHDPAWGERFPDMSAPYDAALRHSARECAEQLHIPLHEGVYVGVHGPCLETPAETRFFRLAGGDAIGMSTIQEVLVARQAGIRVAGFSVITNVNDPADMRPARFEEVVAAAERAAPRLACLISALLGGEARRNGREL